MAATRPDVVIQKASWVDIYAVTGIAVGTAVSVYNKGGNRCYLVSSAAQPPLPTATPMGIPLYTGTIGSFAAVASGEPGLWIYTTFGTIVLVQE